MHHHVVMKRVYREDTMAKENWSSIVSRVPLDRPVEVQDATNREQMDREYLQVVLKPRDKFCVDHNVTTKKDDSSEETTQARDYFHVINVSADKHKLHAMHTFDLADEPQCNQGYTIEVQCMDRWQPEGCFRWRRPKTLPCW